LLAEKRRANGSNAGSRLASAVPESEALLEAALRRGESPHRQARLLVGLLDHYGAAELRAAIREALQGDTPRASSIAFMLQKRWRSSKRRPTPRVVPARPDVADIHVQPNNLEIYDELSKSKQ
jgi:hypothetical protein